MKQFYIHLTIHFRSNKVNLLLPISYKKKYIYKILKMTRFKFCLYIMVIYNGNCSDYLYGFKNNIIRK